MLKLTLFLSLALSCTLAQAQTLTTAIDYLRSTPATIDGSLSFKSSNKIFEEGHTTVSLNANETIGFTFKENLLEVHPGKALKIRCYGIAVRVNYVRWNPQRGFYADAYLPIDPTGLSSSFVEDTVQKDLEEIFGNKLRRANELIRSVRSQQTIGSTQRMISAVIDIFKSGESRFTLPNYQGEAGLHFRPRSDKALNLYGMRVGIKGGDSVRFGFRFNGDRNAIYPYAATFTSAAGVDANEGLQFRQNRRMIIERIDVSSAGADFRLDLGASQTIRGLLSAVELLAAQSGRPVSHCQTCYDLAALTPFRLQLEGQMRQAIVAQIDNLAPMLRNLRVSDQIINAFRNKETCKITNFNCARACAADDTRCKNTCSNKLNACMR